jgi:uncharacterized protein YqgV (UPF0045/DUF77 family)
MEIAVEISLYPIANDYIPPIKAFIDRLNTHAGLKIVTNSMSTQVFGKYERVMDVLKQELRGTFVGERKSVFVMKFIGPFSEV